MNKKLKNKEYIDKYILQFFRERHTNMQDIKSIKDCSEGVGQKVFIVTSRKSKYVFKFPIENKNSIYNTNFIMDNCLKLKLKTPKIIFSDKNYFIESFLEGTSLQKSKLTKEEYKKIFFNMGKFLKKLHSIKSFGYTKNNAKITKDSGIKLSIYINKEFKEHLKFLTNSDLIENKFIQKIKNYFDKNKAFLEKDKLVLSHDDLNENHVFVLNKKFGGIIDFDDGGFKHPASEFRHLYFKLKDNYKFKSLIEGYKDKVNLKKVEFFIFLDCLWRIPCYYREKRYEDYKENKDYLLKIIK